MRPAGAAFNPVFSVDGDSRHVEMESTPMKPVHNSIAVATVAQPAPGGRMLAGSAGWMALFALSSTAVLAVRPSLALTLAVAAALSAAGVWLARRAASTMAEGPHRTAARMVSPVLMAALLWLALAAQVGSDLSFAASVALAGGTFLALVAAEAALASAVAFVLARSAGEEPGIPVALLLADRFAGLAGDVN